MTPRVLPVLLDAAFEHPRGLLGRLGGAVMSRVNAEQEKWAVQRAQLTAGERVLVIGPGPGVGLALAAAAVGPTGRVVGVEPSPVMRRMAAVRCREPVQADVVEIRDGGVEDTGCPPAWADAVLSVNNVMLWDRPVAFRELARVVRPGGRLLVTVHRHVFDVAPERLGEAAEEAGFTDIELGLRPRRVISPAVELVGRRPVEL